MIEDMIKKQNSMELNEININDKDEDKKKLILDSNKYEDEKMIKIKDMDYSSTKIINKIIYQNRIFKTIFISILLLIIIKKIDNIKICLCAIAKKENLYIPEYLNYYKNIGYSHIFLYDNNEIGDEKCEDVISKDLIDNFVTIIDYREIKGKHVPRQFDAYYDCYEKNNENYDWLSFFDLDEFLEFNNSLNLQTFFGDEKFKECQVIKINWLMYSDNDLLYYENKPLVERFNESLFNDPNNIKIKSTVRGNLRTNYWEKYHSPHTALTKYRNCNSAGERVSIDSYIVVPPHYEYAYIKHYAVKTIEEFCIKIKRGYPDQVVIYNDETMKRYFDYFFTRCKKTKEKLDYIKKIFNYTYL